LNLLDVLAAAEMRQLDQRISIRAALKPLNREEVEAYIAHRLWVARGSTAVSFEPAALDRVHAYTGGVPRIINLLCDRSLMQSAQMRISRVTSAIIDAAARSIGLKLHAGRRGKRRAAGVESTRWVAGIVATVVALLAAAMIWFVPIDRLVDVGVPGTPNAPTYQSRYPFGAKPIPQPDLLLPVPPTPPLAPPEEPTPDPASTAPASPRFSR